MASGFHKLFKNDAKIAESLKPATTKNLNQGLATTLSGALKYQWIKFTLGTLYRNAPDRILGIKLPKALNEATAGAALKYHIKRALERSHSISEFSKNLELSAKNAKFSNNTLKIIEELNNGVKQASEEIKEKATKYEKALQELQKIDESKLTKEQQQVLKVFKGELDKGEIKKIDLNDLYILEQGTRHAGAKKILVKHYGEESTGGLTNDELINMSEVIKNGSVLLESFERLKNGFRYAYEWENNGVKLRLVVDDLNNGNKIFDFYSDRNFTDFRGASLHSGNHPYEPNPTQKPLTDQEDLSKNTELHNESTQEATKLSPLELAQAEKLAKLESERLESEQEFLKAKEQESKRKAALKKKLEHERGNALNIESQTKIEVGEDIPAQALKEIPKSRVRLNEREIYDLDYAIVKAKDLKPSFTTGGTQKRTDMNEEQIKSIAENFDPKKIFGSGGFEDLPIILHDGQVIAGNHRIQGMLNFTPKISKILELSAKNSQFSNNTLKIIEELNSGVKQASDEIKEKAFDFSNEKLTNEQIKELLNNAEIPTSGRDAITFGTNNLNPEMVEFLHKNNKKMIIEKASNKELELLADANFKHPENIRASLDHDAIAHILKRHGVNSVNVRNGEIPITYEDIANYRYIVNNADAILRTLDKYDQEAITAFKQVNGYAVVVEQAINKKNELALKTMYKNNGSYENNEVYKELQDTKPSKGQP
ncbi:DUF3519 domain-containing protein [Helicobacter pylori]|uniref:DUF3519 domain-containing protein n=1 Tax=Helicobacter pylori TaxID=210 RepID=UPI00398CBAF8